MTTNHGSDKWPEYKGLGFSLNPYRRNRPLAVDIHRWSPELEEVLQRSGLASVAVYDWDDPEHGLDFLAKYEKQLQFLDLLDPSIRDRSVVSALGRLEELWIEGSVEDVDFSNLSRLHTCSLGAAPSPGNVWACPALQHLTLRKVKKVEDFAIFAPLARLVTLALDSVPLRSLRQIEQLQALRKLDLTQCRRLDSLEGIEHTRIEELWLDILPRLYSIMPLTKLQTLKILKLASCKRIADWEKIGEIQSLEQIGIMLGREISSLAFLRGLRNLRDFRISGKIVNGNLGILLELPKLEMVSIVRDMRHYSHTEEQLNEILQKRHQPAE